MWYAERLARGAHVHEGVIKDARVRQRQRRRWWLLGTTISVALAAVVVALVVGGGGAAGRGGRMGRIAATSEERGFSPGRGTWSFTLGEPAGVIVLARTSSPRGVRASVNATIPGVAGVQFGTRRGPGPLSLACALHGSTNVCTQAVEWCPMPQAKWRLSVTKLAGPGGEIRVDFVVATKPAHTLE